MADDYSPVRAGRHVTLRPLRPVDDDTLHAMVQLWNDTPMNRNGHITAFVRPELRGRGWPLEGIFLFIEHVFPVVNLRKLYFESLDTEVVQYGSLVGPFLRREALYREHQWSFGRFADIHVPARYEEDLPRLLDMVFPDRRALAAEVAPV